MRKVLYTAAHGGFALDHIPLGGGAAVCEHLVEEWRRTRPFDLEVLTPAILGPTAPREKDLVRYSEWSYARFCWDFERAITENILRHPPGTIVLSNDVSEGPDFKLLAEKRYRLYTIYHVDVVDYFTRLYLREKVKPETLTKAYAWMQRAGWHRFLPSIAGLVVQKQQDSVLYSEGLIVPSSAMRDVLLRCYPQVSPQKIHVLPWGIWNDPADVHEAEREKNQVRQYYRIPADAVVLLTLSRLSPEKGQDRLLEALALWEKQDDFPKEGLWLFIAGEAAYMQGKKFESRLRQLAGCLKKTQVIFPGYVAGARKQALFRLADLYVFPSRHESYGLTLLEAMRAGLPALACNDYGARDVMTPEVGELLPDVPDANVPAQIALGLRRLLADRARLKKMGTTAKAHAEAKPFSKTAADVAELISRE